MKLSLLNMKNISTSISITYNQKEYVDNHPKFNLSKFVQLMLEDYINVAKMVERDIQQKEATNNEKTTKQR